ncbi:FAS1-like dehydratase domain-containing protein [Streptomyces tubercidicus]|uniref:UPF0336 protein n=1 Tax=Streptomyces tubercidicus TaxID=47759 RepID=A0A640UYK2_9ACTN|nr:MaoC family dehydratase N-terminal domain-containing protein [Streptomyces tubercidicus]WAU15334.1 MaoC family dehydratase N-terminal domain-containing protein [Streptomyces tubercidicus]GFE41173.1 UPF0336 protein [Streptomyces tubercidicus]
MTNSPGGPLALNTSYLGKWFPGAEPYEVTRAAIREFAEAVGDPNHLYHDPAVARAAGYPDVIAPPTFAGIVAGHAYWQLLEDPEFGLDPSGAVHAVQRFTFQRPLHAGDELWTDVTPEAMDTVAGRDRVTFRSVVRSARQQPVATVLTTLLAE